MDHNFAACRAFLEDHTTHDPSFDEGSVRGREFNDLADLRGDQGNYRADRTCPVILQFVSVAAGQKHLQVAAEFLQSKGDLPLDLRNCRNGILGLARERNIGRRHMDEDKYGSGGEARLGNPIGFPVHILNRICDRTGPLLIKKRNTVCKPQKNSASLGRKFAAVTNRRFHDERVTAVHTSGTGPCLDEVKLELLLHAFHDQFVGDRGQTL